MLSEQNGNITNNYDITPLNQTTKEKEQSTGSSETRHFKFLHFQKKEKKRMFNYFL